MTETAAVISAVFFTALYLRVRAINRRLRLRLRAAREPWWVERWPR